MGAPDFGLPRSEGVITSLSATMISTTPPAPRTDELVNPTTVAIEHMIVMMGRLESSMNEVVKAVKTPPLRPDPAPPFGRQESAPTQQSGTPHIPGPLPQPISQQLGFTGQTHQRRAADLSGPQYVTAPFSFPMSLPRIYVQPSLQQNQASMQYAGNLNLTLIVWGSL